MGGRVEPGAGAVRDDPFGPGDQRPEPPSVCASAGPCRALVRDHERLAAGGGSAIRQAKLQGGAVAGQGCRNGRESSGDVLPGLGRGLVHEVEDGSGAGRRSDDVADHPLALAGLEDAQLSAGPIGQEPLSEALPVIGRGCRIDVPNRSTEQVGQRRGTLRGVIRESRPVACDAPALAAHGVESRDLVDVPARDLADGWHRVLRRRNEPPRAHIRSPIKPTPAEESVP